MQTIASRISVTIVIFAFLPAAQAQLEVGSNLLDSCSKVDALQKAGNYSDARAAARRCLDGLDEKLEGQVGQYFRNEVAGWKRTQFKQNKAMGFATTTARYEKEGKTANVTLTGGAGSASSFGALSNIASMGMLQSGRQVRVAGLPAAVNPDGTIMVTLEDGSFLNFDSPDFNDADAALAGIGSLVNEFPVAEINETLVAGSR